MKSSDIIRELKETVGNLEYFGQTSPDPEMLKEAVNLLERYPNELVDARNIARCLFNWVSRPESIGMYVKHWPWLLDELEDKERMIDWNE